MLIVVTQKYNILLLVRRINPTIALHTGSAAVRNPIPEEKTPQIRYSRLPQFQGSFCNFGLQPINFTLNGRKT